jgi:hypothetical protein
MPPADRYAIIPAADRARAPTVRRPRLPEDRKLTARQQRFVDELVANDGAITLREAATRAGFAPQHAHRAAYQMTNPRIMPHVVAAIRRARDEQDRKFAIDHKRHLRDLQRIRDAALAAGQYGAAVQAEYRRGQAHGNIYVHKSEVRHGSIDTMSKEEVLRALQELSDGGRLIDVSPTRGEDEGGDDAERAREGSGDMVEDPQDHEELRLDMVEDRNMGDAGDP